MEDPCYIKKLSANCLSNVFQFFNSEEMIKYSRVSQQFKSTADIDYLWKALASNESIFIQKRYKETWKKAYFRKFLGVLKNMKGDYIDPKTGKASFQFEMAPIRKHDDLISQVEIYGNLIISLDEGGRIVLSFISYEDPEESKSNIIEEFEGRKVRTFQYSEDNRTLFVIDVDLNMCLYQLDLDEELQECKVSATLYSKQVDYLIDEDAKAGWLSRALIHIVGNKVFISPDYRFRADANSPGSVLIVNRETGDLIHIFTIHDDSLEDAMNVDYEEVSDPIPIWNYFGTNNNHNSF